MIDGDTLAVRGARIRLHGIDASESAQLCKDAEGKDYRCGQTAALDLSDHIGQLLVTAIHAIPIAKAGSSPYAGPKLRI